MPKPQHTRHSLSLPIVSIIRKALLLTASLWFPYGICAEPKGSLFDRGLEQLARNPMQRRNNSSIQTFFCHEPQSERETDYRYVYWPEARLLLYLPNVDQNDRCWSSMQLVSRSIDLENGVVTNVEDIGGSSYLEVESTVVQIVQKCLVGRRVFVLTGEMKRGPAPAQQKR